MRHVHFAHFILPETRSYNFCVHLQPLPCLPSTVISQSPLFSLCHPPPDPLHPLGFLASLSSFLPSFFGSDVCDFPSWLCPSAAEGPTPAHKIQGPTRKHTHSPTQTHHLPTPHTLWAPRVEVSAFSQLASQDELLKRYCLPSACWRMMTHLSSTLVKSKISHKYDPQRMIPNDFNELRPLV